MKTGLDLTPNAQHPTSNAQGRKRHAGALSEMGKARIGLTQRRKDAKESRGRQASRNFFASLRLCVRPSLFLA
jgi:hypothetical protein